jgi:hypothetical protein
VRGPNPDLEGAFQTAVKGRASAVITITNNLLFRNSKRIADLAIKNRLPSMYEGSAWIEAGGLMSYSANDAESFRRAAYYMDRIADHLRRSFKEGIPASAGPYHYLDARDATSSIPSARWP